MKLALAMNVPYARVYGGANRSNRALAEALAARGHEVHVITPALAVPSTITREDFVAGLAAEGVAVRSEGSVDRFNLGGVEVHALAEQSQLRGYLTQALGRLEPDWVLVSSEDPSQNLLDAALQTCPSRVVYMALTPPMLPFGPVSLYPGEARTALLGRAAGIVSISDYLARYIKEWAGFESFVFVPPHYGAGPFPDFGRFDDGYVLLMNACAMKGLPVFLSLARMLPRVSFAALHGYGTTEADREALKSLPNVSILENSKNLDDIFRQTRVLLMPSLWAEGFPLAVIDAMLRGIPVMAAAHSGLVEAKLGTDYLLPVRPIEHFADSLDDNMLPSPIIPEQDVEPWRDALVELLTDGDVYRRQSEAARTAARAYVARLGVEPLEEFLRGLETRPRPGGMRPETPEAKKDDAFASAAALTPEQKALLMLRLRKKARAAQVVETGKNSIPSVSRDLNTPLSFAQNRLWFLDQLEPGNPFYNCPIAIRLRGRLDAAALAGALGEIVRRHEVLRTTFKLVGDRPIQIISEREQELPVVDLSGRPGAEQEARRLLYEEARRPFRLDEGPLLRTTLIRMSEHEHVLVAVVHHIVADGWSTGILVREIKTLYESFSRGESSPLAELQIQYADFAHWQHEHLQGERMEKLINFWEQQLGGNLPVLELPADRPRANVQTFAGARHALALPRSLTEELGALCRAEGATLFMLLLSAFKVLLHRHTRQADIIVGAPIANRNRREIEDLIGFFVNTLVLRTDISGDPTFQELLRRVSRVTLEAYDHQDLPFEKLVEVLQPGRDMGHSALFQVMFVLQNAQLAPLELPGLMLTPVDLHSGTSKFDLTLEMVEAEEGLTALLEYNTDLFDAATAEGMLEQYQTLLEAVVREPRSKVSALPLLSPEAERRLLSEFNDTAVAFPPPHCIHQIFEEQVELTPDAVALVFEEEQLTYRELNRRANQLAHHLRSFGVGPDVPVGICMGRSIETIIAVLGTLKAGGAYLPLDPVYPAERLAFMLEDCQASVLLTQSDLLGALPPGRARVLCLDDAREELNGESDANPRSGVAEENLGYIIYTSGSTGRPKGVSLPQRALVNLLRWHCATLRPGARTLQFASLSFDASFHEIFAALFTGGTLYLMQEGLRRDMNALAVLMRDQAIEKIILPVVVLQELAAEARERGHEFPRLKEVMATGEQLQVNKSVIDWFDDMQGGPRGGGCSLHNHYGPSETHVVTSYTLPPAPRNWPTYPPIGRPVANTQIYILDAQLNPTPTGVPGELYIGGANLARGYFNRPDLTAEKFIPNPHGDEAGGRLYKTGDLARYRADGNIEYLCRIDHQLKVRGFRVEPGEVESVLGSHPAVEKTVVLLREFAPGDRRLVGYVVGRQGPRPSASELREFLLRKLPEYMIPSAYVFLDALPLTPNGKLDRDALPMPDSARPDVGGGFVAPRTEIEKSLAEIWAGVLGIDLVGVNDNFFELGGHSLLMIQIVSRISEALHVELPLKDFFQLPTVAEQAAAVGRLMAEGSEQRGIEQLLDDLDQLSPEEVRRLLDERALTQN
ncbi:MAG TPA: amino acid adenylation domain-containing protein [Pyrinomonadaceae bacterium]